MNACLCFRSVLIRSLKHSTQLLWWNYSRNPPAILVSIPARLNFAWRSLEDLHCYLLMMVNTLGWVTMSLTIWQMRCMVNVTSCTPKEPQKQRRRSRIRTYKYFTDEKWQSNERATVRLFFKLLFDTRRVRSIWWHLGQYFSSLPRVIIFAILSAGQVM